MGVNKIVSKLLVQEASVRPFYGALLQLGKQDIRISRLALESSLKKRGIVFSGSSQDNEWMSDTEYFQKLGFSEVCSLDYSDFEGADFAFDMNCRDVPEELKGRFDFIFDGGTMEHVFSVPNVFNNIFDMLKVGGTIIHFSPVFNHVDHGFYFFSPTLFRDFYAANGFETKKIFLIKQGFWRSIYSSYLENAPDHEHIRGPIGFKEGMYLFCVSKKTSASTGSVYPSQGHYLQEWRQDSQTKSKSKFYRTSIKAKAKRALPSFVYWALREWYVNSIFRRVWINNKINWKRL